MLIAQISDLHLRACGRPLHGAIDTEAAVVACIDHLLRLHPRPNVVLATGDLVDLGRPEDYALLYDHLARLPMPVLLIPGNHDDRAGLAAAFADYAYMPRDGFIHYAIEDWPLRLLGLDTLLPGEMGGGLCAERLRWLADRLAEQPERPTLLFMHHPPFVTGIRFLDTPFVGAEAMAAIVRQHPQVRQIVCGHLHRAVHHSWAGTTAAIAPSVVYQMSLALNDGESFYLLNQPSAMSLYLWSGEGAPVGYLSLIGMTENRQMAEGRP
ncbi:phosphodiesterase [Defluviicoccus vanus]|uniref:Phosphodiesterase n=1 Tax=Defluviicoccus vanus TaxID=111831 RepID=A0A7H1N259_9PROT|nr:phosphodiesterase [Defluviicoccus vanus]QNT69795.1 phosphodiesterase [Defluviicoccus vanus]